MKQPINRETLTAALETVVQERGDDWTYPDPTRDDDGLIVPSAWHAPLNGSCVYFTRDEEQCPACLVGAALAHLGYGPADVAESNDAGSVIRDLGCGDESLRSALNSAQARQDEGETWGYALEAYRARLEDSDREREYGEDSQW